MGGTGSRPCTQSALRPYSVPIDLYETPLTASHDARTCCEIQISELRLQLTAAGVFSFDASATAERKPQNEEAVPLTGGTASERGSLGRDEPTSNGSEVGALKPHYFGMEVNECLALKKENRAEEGPTRFLRHTNISDTNRRTQQASRNRGRSRFTTFVSKTGFRQRTLRLLLDLSLFSTGELTKTAPGADRRGSLTAGVVLPR